MTSARDCNITASSNPIVAARVGDMTSGRSGNSDEVVVDDTVGNEGGDLDADMNRGLV